MERIYLDTSVFGGYFEEEFELWTRVLFNKIKNGDYTLMYSDAVDGELLTAPKYVKDLLLDIPKDSIEFIKSSKQADSLAKKYVSEKVVGSTSLTDCLHIALATLFNADILVSWNFKHIVNIRRIRGYNAINYSLGHQLLEIRTPREILEL